MIDKIKVDNVEYNIKDSEVKEWARQNTKPVYNYSEIENTPSIPSKTSDLTNDNNFINNTVNNLVNYYLKSEVDGKVSAVYKYRGSVATYENLPNQGQIIGDVYNVESDGSNYAWAGLTWDKLGGTIDLSNYQTLITPNNKISADNVDDTNSTNKFFSGNYNDLSNKPTIPVIPTNVSSFTNDAGYQNATQVQNAIDSVVGNINTILATLTTPQGGNE